VGIRKKYYSGGVVWNLDAMMRMTGGLFLLA